VSNTIFETGNINNEIMNYILHVNAIAPFLKYIFFIFIFYFNTNLRNKLMYIFNNKCTLISKYFHLFRLSIIQYVLIYDIT